MAYYDEGLIRRDIVKSEIKEFLKTNKRMTARFSKTLLQKYGYQFSATASLVAEIREEARC